MNRNIGIHIEERRLIRVFSRNDDYLSGQVRAVGLVEEGEARVVLTIQADGDTVTVELHEQQARALSRRLTQACAEALAALKRAHSEEGTR